MRIIIIVFTLFLSSCKEEDFRLTDLRLQNNYYYIKSDTLRFSGRIRTLFPDNTVSNEFKFVDGVPSGKWTAYGYKGEVIQDGKYQPLDVSDNKRLVDLGIKRLNLCHIKESDISFIDVIVILNEHHSNNQQQIESQVTGYLNEKKQYYLDLNQRTLEGILPSSTLSYPSFEIRGNNTQKEIIFHTSTGTSYVKKYDSKKGVWCGFDSYKGDTCMVFSYEYVLKDRLIQFSYSDTTHMKLMDVMEVRGKDRTIWYPEPGFSISPDPANVHLIAGNYAARYTEKYSQKDSLLIQSSKREDAKGRVMFQNQHTYRANSRSMFWWYYFGERQKVL